MHHRDAVRRGPRTRPDAVTSEQCKQSMHRRDSSAFNPPSVPELLFSDDRSTALSRCNPKRSNQPTCCNRFWPCAALPSSGFALSLSLSLSLRLPLSFDNRPRFARIAKQEGRSAHNCETGPTTRPARSNLEKFYGNPLPYSLLSLFSNGKDVDERLSWHVITPRSATNSTRHSQFL